MSMNTDATVVQTELGGEEYERFRRVAESEGLSLKEALRTAATEFVERHERHDPDDPFFTAPAANEDGESLTATETETYLYDEE